LEKIDEGRTVFTAIRGRHAAESGKEVNQVKIIHKNSKLPAMCDDSRSKAENDFSILNWFLTEFSPKYPPQAVEYYRGMFHHLEFNWRLHVTEYGWIPLDPLLPVFIKGKEMNRLVEFLTGYVRSIVDGYEEQFLLEAFGEFDTKEIPAV